MSVSWGRKTSRYTAQYFVGKCRESSITSLPEPLSLVMILRPFVIESSCCWNTNLYATNWSPTSLLVAYGGFPGNYILHLTNQALVISTVLVGFQGKSNTRANFGIQCSSLSLRPERGCRWRSMRISREILLLLLFMVLLEDQVSSITALACVASSCPGSLLTQTRFISLSHSFATIAYFASLYTHGFA